MLLSPEWEKPTLEARDTCSNDNTLRKLVPVGHNTERKKRSSGLNRGMLDRNLKAVAPSPSRGARSKKISGGNWRFTMKNPLTLNHVCSPESTHNREKVQKLQSTSIGKVGKSIHMLRPTALNGLQLNQILDKSQIPQRRCIFFRLQSDLCWLI